MNLSTCKLLPTWVLMGAGLLLATSSFAARAQLGIPHRNPPMRSAAKQTPRGPAIPPEKVRPGGEVSPVLSAGVVDRERSLTIAPPGEEAPEKVPAADGKSQFTAAPPGEGAPSGLTVTSPPSDAGLSRDLSWTRSPADPGPGATGSPVLGYAVMRSEKPEGPFEVVHNALGPGVTSVRDQVTTDPVGQPPGGPYYYRVAVRTAYTEGLSGEATVAATALGTAREDLKAKKVGPEEVSRLEKEELRLRQAYIAALTSLTPVASGTPQGSWFHRDRLALLILLLAFAAIVFHSTRAMQRGRTYFIRRIPGIDAIEEAIGRATEMGRPILYVPGINELQDIQTIASMLILGRVAEIVAQYESDMIVPCTYPVVREVADEVVRAGYYAAGRPEAYDPRNVRFISSEQFAFCAGTNGIILRQKPAANLYLGCFFAESLIFAETGYVNRSIQIAGTAELTQLPFFIVSCDYTILGEELFAVSAYLARDPRLISSLRASDIIKMVVVASIVVGTVLASLGYPGFAELWKPAVG